MACIRAPTPTEPQTGSRQFKHLLLANEEESAQDKNRLRNMQTPPGEVWRREAVLLSLPESRLRLCWVSDTKNLAIRASIWLSRPQNIGRVLRTAVSLT